jgi:hypothetical protein
MSHPSPAYGVEIVTLGEADFPAEWGTDVPPYAFKRRLDVVEVKFPARITEIGDYAFADCCNLRSLTLPPRVKVIYRAAFNNCIGLRGSLTIPPTLRELGEDAFTGCSGLSGELVIPGSLGKVSQGAFQGCNGLTSVRLAPTELRSRIIDFLSFRGCSALSSVHLFAGVSGIKQSAFAYCDGLTSIALPQNLRVLEEGAFEGSTANVRVLVVPKTVSNQVCVAVVKNLAPNLPMLEMVSAPDAVVSALDDHFLECRTMADVPSARRANSESVLQVHFWSHCTHRYLCTASQKACVITAMLVGTHTPHASVEGRQTTGGLPELPSELWIDVILTCLRRCDFGPTEPAVPRAWWVTRDELSDDGLGEPDESINAWSDGSYSYLDGPW